MWHAGPRGGEGKGREPPFSSPPHPTHPPAPTRACTQDKPSTFPRRTPPLPLPPSPATSCICVGTGRQARAAGRSSPPAVNLPQTHASRFPSLLPPPHLHGQRAGLPHPVPPSGTRLCPSASEAGPPGSRGLAAPLAGYCCGATTRPPALKPPPLPSRHQPTAHLPISRRVILREFSWEGPPTLFFCLSRGLDAALNSTEEMRFPQTQLHNDITMCCKVATPLKSCVVQVGLGHGHIPESMNRNNHMKRFDHCLWLCSMARTTAIFPGCTGYFLRKKSGQFEGRQSALYRTNGPASG